MSHHEGTSWTKLGGFVLTIGGVFARMFTSGKINDERHQENLGRFDKIMDKLDAQDREASEHRHKVNNDISAIRQRVVIISTLMVRDRPELAVFFPQDKS